MTKFNDNTLAWVAHYTSEGKRPVEIIDFLSKERGVTITYANLYDNILPTIRERHWLRAATPIHSPLSERIKKQHSRLQEVCVTYTNYIDDVASHAAYMIRDLIKKKLQVAGKTNVHVGFSGGNTTRRLFQKLADCLTDGEYNLPHGTTLVCHALVGGFDNEAPGTDPSSFFTYLDDRQTSFTKQFVLLHAPAFVRAAKLTDVLNVPLVRKAQLLAAGLDLIVTSAASFADEHSQLRRFYEDHDQPGLNRLNEGNCLDDMLWLPLNANGPMDLSGYNYRPVTLLQLGDLPSRIRSSTSVLLVIGPCADPKHPCDELKTPILKAILSQQTGNEENQLITHLVVDNATANQLLRDAPNGDAKAAGAP